jgi:Leucine-rich repeat (LRR) protein
VGTGGPLPLRGLRTLWKLQGLNLSHNVIAGKLSPDLARLTSLLVLNLSSNQLTGKIPAQLSTLTALKKMELQRNNLTGTAKSPLRIRRQVTSDGALAQTLFLSKVISQIASSKA